VEVSQRLLQMGCNEISLGDTIGRGNPVLIKRLIDQLVQSGISLHQLAVHCHDTYGMALANIFAALEV
jgi:hydroxymethylglutaryl-CoA lyase